MAGGWGRPGARGAGRRGRSVPGRRASAAIAGRRSPRRGRAPRAGGGRCGRAGGRGGRAGPGPGRRAQARARPAAAARQRTARPGPRGGTARPGPAGGGSRDTRPRIQGGLWRVTRSTRAASASVRQGGGVARRLGLAGEPLLVDGGVGVGCGQELLELGEGGVADGAAQDGRCDPGQRFPALGLALRVGLDRGQGGEPGGVVQGVGVGGPAGHRPAGCGRRPAPGAVAAVGRQFVRAILVGGHRWRRQRRGRRVEQPVLDRLPVGEKGALGAGGRGAGGGLVAQGGGQCGGVARLGEVGAVAAARGVGDDPGQGLDQAALGADLQPHGGGQRREQLLLGGVARAVAVVQPGQMLGPLGGDSSGSRPKLRARRPWRTAFREERALPSGVRGPRFWRAGAAQAGSGMAGSGQGKGARG